VIDAPALEVATIFQRHGTPYLERYGASSQQRRVMRDVQACRTAALGGHEDECDRCGHRVISYNSCRNRHCPKCQGPARARWLEARAGELLPVPYFHVVFTLPGVLAPLALHNPGVVYGLLFDAVSATLLEVAANPRWLGARIGFLAILHTWGQNLMYHPHLHCVVPAGGIAPDGTRWTHGRADFFLPVRVLSRVMRGKFIAGLKRAADRGRLRFRGRLKPLARRAALEKLLDQAVRHEWVVYAKPPFGGPAQVLKYLARYTHRVAISNRRLLKLENGKVTFRWKDYAHGNQPGVMTLEANEFIRRFLLHVLPRGLVRIRYYGFMANRHRAQNLERCRRMLAQGMPPSPRNTATDRVMPVAPTTVNDPDHSCPRCGRGKMHVIGLLERPQLSWASPRVRTAAVRRDTS